MSQLIRNEWRKTCKEPALWFSLALHLSPLAMVAAATMMGAVEAGEKTYFIFYNQSMIVTGLVACVVVSLVFHVEFSNRTWFDWLIQPQGPVRLVAAKILAAGLILGSYIGLYTVLMLIFLFLQGASGDWRRIILSYLVFQAGTMGVMLAIGSALCVAARNTVVVNVVGVTLSMVTLVLMGADFSWLVPTAWAYRAGLAILDPTYGFGGAAPLFAGGAIAGSFAALCLSVATMQAGNPRVINAAMR